MAIILHIHPTLSLILVLTTDVDDLEFDFTLLSENTINELLMFLKLSPSEIQKIVKNIQEIRSETMPTRQVTTLGLNYIFSISTMLVLVYPLFQRVFHFWKKNNKS